jgi:phosphoribosylformimino-5-aminoimidazole carboxamide ribotide isomerase
VAALRRSERRLRRPSANSDAIKSIRAAIICRFNWAAASATGGGGSWLAAGITRVILGTAALTNPQFVKEAARLPGRIVVGADAKGGKIATQGWAEVSELTPVELGKRFEDAGVAAILFTDIDGDGMLGGSMSRPPRPGPGPAIPVIASGGVGSIADIDALLAAEEPGIEGVVVGRALYDGRIDPSAAALH